MRKLLLIGLMMLATQTWAQFAQVQQTAAGINQDSLITYVKQLTGLLPIEGQTVLNSRVSGTVGNTLTANFIKQKLTQWGVPFDTVNFGSTGTNIIAKIPGRRTDKVILIGAHYDAVGSSTNFNFFYPGADDNASGTAAVLEAVRVCAQQQFPVSLEFAFWDEEEQGLLGSKASVLEYMHKLAAYINLDMIAWSPNNDSVAEIHTTTSGYSVELANKVVNIASLYAIPLNPVIMNPGDPNTDHGAFWQYNLTAVGINEIYNGPKMNPNWHRLTDSLSTFNLKYFYDMSHFATTTFLHLAMDTSTLIGVNDLQVNNNMLAVYPNPFTTAIQLDVNSHLKVTSAKLVNMLGEEIPTLLNAANQLILNTPAAAGIYFVDVTLQQGNSTSTLRKKVVLRN